MKTVTCKRCGKEFETEARYVWYCGECKKKLKQEQNIAPKEPVVRVERKKPKQGQISVNREANAMG